ncbi:hypothetical protein A0H81_09312 [Grifola frondosa]|uniref:DUF6593 domain-containing protein n=1 Tax=Grifola frondosa TaxID=5627 RepID=A0A1C7M1E1_GRIFR|nr:hypothetical protein A0H81_09312 [Grifola frondosa]
MPYFLEDSTGELTGSEFVDLYNRMHLSLKCTLRDAHHIAYVIYDSLSCRTSPGRGGLLVPLASLDFGANNALGTIKIGDGEHVNMNEHLAKTSTLGSSKTRKFVASDGQEYKWTWQGDGDAQWTCLNSNGYHVASYSLKPAGEPKYSGSSGCMLTVEESYPHIVGGELFSSSGPRVILMLCHTAVTLFRHCLAMARAGSEYKSWEIAVVISQQSTLARELAEILRVPHVALDTLYWLPSWGASTSDAFRAKIRTALNQDPRGWVVDGMYTMHLGDFVAAEATDVIWLDPPLVQYLPRLCLRTLLRLFGLAPPCSPGCDESVRDVFSRNGIVWWCVSQHWRVRKVQTERMRADGVHVGGKRRRIGGWGGELVVWKQSVRQAIRV